MTRKQEFEKAKAQMDAIQAGINVKYYIKAFLGRGTAHMILGALADFDDAGMIAIDEGMIVERYGRELGADFVQQAKRERENLIALAEMVLGDES